MVSLEMALWMGQAMLCIAENSQSMSFAHNADIGTWHALMVSVVYCPDRFRQKVHFPEVLRTWILHMAALAVHRLKGMELPPEP